MTARHDARKARRALRRVGLGHLARKVVPARRGEYPFDYRCGMSRGEWEAVSTALGRGDFCTDDEWNYYHSFPATRKPEAS